MTDEAPKVPLPLRLCYWLMFGVFGTVIGAALSLWSVVAGVAVGAGFSVAGGVMAEPFLESICRAKARLGKEDE